MKKSLIVSAVIIGVSSVALVELVASAGWVSPSQKICAKSMRETVVKLEAKQAKLDPAEVNIIDQKYQGSGENLFLFSFYIAPPKKGNNALWEIVGELDSAGETCTAVFHKRYSTQ